MKENKNNMKQGMVLIALAVLSLSLVIFSGCSTNTTTSGINVSTINTSSPSSSNTANNTSGYTNQINSTINNGTISQNSTVSIGSMI